MNNIEIRKALDSEKEIIENIYQFYEYDFSEMTFDDVEPNGLFERYKYIDRYFTDEDRTLYYVFVSGKIAGFVMMNKYPYLLPEKVNSIAEFFIMRKYRRSGIGQYTAKYIFENYPGRMIFEVRKLNTKAIAFWQKATDDNNIKIDNITYPNHDGVDWIIHDIFIEGKK